MMFVCIRGAQVKDAGLVAATLIPSYPHNTEAVEKYSTASVLGYQDSNLE